MQGQLDWNFPASSSLLPLHELFVQRRLLLADRSVQHFAQVTGYQ